MVRRKISMRSVARRLQVTLSTVQLWFQRAQGRRLDRVDWDDRPSGCGRARNRTPAEVEDQVLELRTQLRDHSALGEFGAAAIHRELIRLGGSAVPTVRTLGRILERRGALDGRRRIRRPAPPRGWYLPDVATGGTELDSFDVVEGLSIEGHGPIDVLNAISLHGGLPGSWPRDEVTAKTAVEAILAHWRDVGLPGYAQFDNDTRFQGPRMYPDSFGRVLRLCLALGCHSRLCSSPRKRVPGGRGKLQRPLAEQGMASVPASLPGRAGGAFRPVCHRRPATRCDSAGSSSGPKSVSGTLASRLASAAAGEGYFLEENHRSWFCQSPGPRILCTSSLVAPLGSCRSRSRHTVHQLFCLAPSRSKGSASAAECFL